MNLKKYKFHFIIILLCISSFYISTYLYQFQLIQGESMSPAYHSWQFVLLNKKVTRLDRGDVISFRCDSLNAILVKRIVACPGDTVQIKKGILYVNGSPSPHAIAGLDYAGNAESPITLAMNEYFVLGDNYKHSKDSRYSQIGCILQEDILGAIIPQKPVASP